jgi:hypothetical protein
VPPNCFRKKRAFTKAKAVGGNKDHSRPIGREGSESRRTTLIGVKDRMAMFYGRSNMLAARSLLPPCSQQMQRRDSVHSRRLNRTEQAILRLVSDFPGLLGPVGVELALRTLAGKSPSAAARAGQLLVLLETRGLICRQDLGNGCFVYRIARRSPHVSEGGADNHGQRRVEQSTPPCARAPHEVVLS